MAFELSEQASIGKGELFVDLMWHPSISSFAWGVGRGVALFAPFLGVVATYCKVSKFLESSKSMLLVVSGYFLEYFWRRHTFSGLHEFNLQID